MGNIRDNVELAEKIFLEHGDFIRSIINFNVKNKAITDDIFQDFFLFLIAKPIPPDVKNVKGFIYRLICDNIKDAFRRVYQRQASMNKYAKIQKGASEKQPDDKMIKNEEAMKIFAIISKYLPSSQAKAITLRYKNGYSDSKIAEEMGVKDRTVSRYLSVGLKKIRKVLRTNQGGKYDYS